MTYLPLIFFGIAAIGGVIMVSMKVQKKAIPLAYAIAHGILAAIGLVILIVNVAANTGIVLMNASLVLFLIAALGGFTLFSYQLRNKPFPNMLIGTHAVVAVIGFILLLVVVTVR